MDTAENLERKYRDKEFYRELGFDPRVKGKRGEKTHLRITNRLLSRLFGVSVRTLYRLYKSGELDPENIRSIFLFWRAQEEKKQRK